MSEPSVHLCPVKTPEGWKHYFTVLPVDVVFSKGLIPEAVIGVLLRPLAADELITPEAFAQNRIFINFMHEVMLSPGVGLYHQWAHSSDGSVRISRALTRIVRPGSSRYWSGRLACSTTFQEDGQRRRQIMICIPRLNHALHQLGHRVDRVCKIPFIGIAIHASRRPGR